MNELLYNLARADLEKLRVIAKRRGITVTEALRLALSLERFLYDAEANGDKIFIQHADGTTEALVRDRGLGAKPPRP